MFQGEIELIKSNIIYDKVIQDLNLHVSYYRMGNILNEELFKNNNFQIDTFEIINPAVYDQKIYLNFLNEKEYELNIKQGKKDNFFVHEFNKLESNPFLKLKIS